MAHLQKNTDVIVVGQGMAGTCLSYQFSRNNIDFTVIDNSHIRSSSMVAAGLINPVVFKRLTKSWLADELMSYLHTFYLEFEATIGTSFYDRKSILRVLNSAEEINRWDSKRRGSLKDYLGEICGENEFELQLNKPANLGVVKAGAIDVPAMLAAWKNRLKEAGNIIENNLDYSMIEYGENKVKIQFKSDSLVGKKIVFCEGALGVNNPLFSWLPFNLSKGDILTLRNDKYLGGEVLNNGKFFLPQSDGTIKMGSTYNWDDLSYETKKERREELQEKAKETLSGNTILINHEAGLRPTVKDRRPFLGRHPIQKNAYIFNGLGTKGAMLAPYFSEEILNFVMNEGSLDQEVDIKRFAGELGTFVVS
ncbi:MAG: FAD-binding oxidoreductase [Flavobacteriales bacterium]|nr:FAD-binding oxidoreductase [Flavobacteriales bacterium]